MYQKLVLVGNLGNDPEMRYTPNGQAVTNLSIATNRQYTANSGEKVKETTWFRVSVWGKQAEACNTYLKKGSKVLVEGRMTADSATGGPRIWTANDGSSRASFEVTAQTVRFLSTRSEDQAAGGGGGGSGSNYGQGQNNIMPPPSDDDIPF